MAFSDTLESYAVGVDPFGAWLDIGFFKGQINTNTLNRNEGSRVYQMGLNGQILWQNLGNASGATTVYWLGANTPNMIVSQTVGTGTGSVGQVFGYFQVELDRTVSLYAVNTFGVNTPFLLGNSVTQVEFLDTWQDFQVSFLTGVGHVVVGTVTNTVLSITGTCWVEGTQVITGGTANTNLLLSGLPQPNGTMITDWQFSASGPRNNGGFIDNLWEADSQLSTATFPFADITHARLTQGVIETLMQGKPAARVTQGAIDILKIPTRSARLTQGVIEIIKRGGSGWVVYEA